MAISSVLAARYRTCSLGLLAAQALYGLASWAGHRWTRFVARETFSAWAKNYAFDELQAAVTLAVELAEPAKPPSRTCHLHLGHRSHTGRYGWQYVPSAVPRTGWLWLGIMRPQPIEEAMGSRAPLEELASLSLTPLGSELGYPLNGIVVLGVWWEMKPEEETSSGALRRLNDFCRPEHEAAMKELFAAVTARQTVTQ